MKDDRCQAMKDAGIRYAESQEGKNFCIKHCPYDKCVVFETIMSRAEQVKKRANKAKELVAKGYSIKTVASLMHRDMRTIEGYLGK